jgi:predicted transposase/invertase (TIGR01784 family)
MSQHEQHAPHPIHDRFVKDFMHDLGNAADIFRLALPTSLAEKLPWHQLRQESGEFINEILRLRNSDLAFSLPWRDTELRLILLMEHQSAVERNAAPRTAEYKLASYLHQAKQGKKPGPAICVIFYHGAEPWRSADNLAEWLSLQEGEAAGFGLYYQQKEYFLLDVSHLNVDEIDARMWVKVALSLLQALRNRTEVEWFHRYGRFLEDWASEPDASARVMTLVRYCLQASGRKISAFQQELTNLPYAKVMKTFKSTADELMEMGREEGREEGLREGMSKGLTQGYLIGKIQSLEEKVGLPETAYQTLEQMDESQLRALLSELQRKASKNGGQD